MLFTKAGLYTFIYGVRVGDARAPPFLKFRSSNALITTTIALAVFTDIFLYSLVVPVLPFALTGRAGVEERDVQKWTSVFLSIYGAALAVASPLCGYFADRSSSRRAPLLLGLLALGGATAMLAAGRSLALLLVGRFLQGVSAAVVWTVGLAVLSDTIEKEYIGQAMGYIAAATSIGSLLGPLLGGVVYEFSGYYAVFALGFAIIGLDIFLRLVMIEKVVAKQWETTPDTSSTSPGNVVSSRDRAERQQVANDSNEKMVLEEHTPDPVPTGPKTWGQRLPPVVTLLRIPRLLAALLGCFVQSNSLGSFDSVLPLFVKDTFRWNSTGAGLIFTCLVIPALLGPIVGMASDKFGCRALTTVGLVISVPAWVCLRFVTENTIGHKVLLCANLATLGLCNTMVMAPLMAEIDHCLTEREMRRPGSLGRRGAAAQGYGLFNLAYAVGSLVGPLWAGFIVSTAGWSTMVWTIGLLSGISAVPIFIYTGGRIMLKGKEGSVGVGGVV